MNRRLFLNLFIKTAVAVPLIGTSTSVFLDSTKVFNPLTADDYIFIEMERIGPKLIEFFDRDDTFYTGISGGGKTYSIMTAPMRVPLKLRPGGYFK